MKQPAKGRTKHINRSSAMATARHEAAHALVSRLLEIPVTSVDVRRRVIERDGEKFLSLGVTYNGEAYISELNGHLNSTPSEPGAEFVRRFATSLCAGMVAEEEGGDEVAWTADKASLEPCLVWLAGGLVAQAEQNRARLKVEFVHALTSADTVLATHAAEWDAIAVRLHRDGRLTGLQIDRILEQRGIRNRYSIGAPESEAGGEDGKS